MQSANAVQSAAPMASELHGFLDRIELLATNAQNQAEHVTSVVSCIVGSDIVPGKPVAEGGDWLLAKMEMHLNRIADALSIIINQIDRL